jgi:uncharacterized membrane protein YkoI
MPITRCLIVAAAAIAPLSSTAALEMPQTQVSMETCLQTVLAARPGEVKHMKLEVEDGRPLYEFTIRTQSRQTWEVECDAMTNEIAEMSRQADRNDAEFKSRAKLLEKDARKAALAKFPGKVTESELEIDRNGRAVYEVSIDGADGREMEVLVDAATGEIIASEDESTESTIYEIGDD